MARHDVGLHMRFSFLHETILSDVGFTWKRLLLQQKGTGILILLALSILLVDGVSTAATIDRAHWYDSVEE